MWLLSIRATIRATDDANSGGVQGILLPAAQQPQTCVAEFPGPLPVNGLLPVGKYLKRADTNHACHRTSIQKSNPHPQPQTTSAAAALRHRYSSISPTAHPGI